MTAQEILKELKTYVALWEGNKRFYNLGKDEWAKGRASGLNRCITSIRNLIETIEREEKE